MNINISDLLHENSLEVGEKRFGALIYRFADFFRILIEVIMTRQQSSRSTKRDTKASEESELTKEDFTIDEPKASTANSEQQDIKTHAEKSAKEESAEQTHGEKPQTKYDPRNQTPANVIFLPNIARGAQEKDLYEFGETLPCKPAKTFVYMSDTAYHGFIECASVEDGIKNLEHINSNELMLKNKRVLAEYSRRKNVLDRDTYEKRQHVRKARGERPSDRDRRDEPRQRRRSRSPPYRESYRSDRGRDWDRDDRWSKDRWDYPSRGGSSWRDDDWKRSDNYGKWPNYEKQQSWDRGYDDRHSSRQKEWDYEYPSRGGSSSYQQPAYDQYESRYPPADRHRYPPREQYPPYEPQGYPEPSAYAHPPAAAPYDAYRGEAPLPVLQGASHPAPTGYRQSPPPSAYGGQAAPAHPLLSLQQPVRATPIGTQQPSYGHPYPQYK